MTKHTYTACIYSSQEIAEPWNPHEEKQVLFHSWVSRYLGHQINAQGLHPTTAKVEAVVKAPVSKNYDHL